MREPTWIRWLSFALLGGVPGMGFWKPWQAYLFAIAVTTGTIAFRIAIDSALGGQATLVIFTLPIMLSACLGGLRAGLLATAVAYVGASYYLLPPLQSFAVASGVERWQQVFVAVVGVFISGLCELLHRARRRAGIANCEQQRAESAHRASEEQFSSSFAHAAVGMALVAPDGRYLRVNRAFCQMLGYSEAELLALTFQEITFAEDLDDRGQVRRLQAGEIESFQMEKRYRHRQGNLVTVLLSVSIVRDEAGRPIHQIAQVQDISERKAHEVEIERLTLLYAALSQINQAIVWTPSRDELFGKICQVLVEDGGFRMAWIGWHDFDHSRLVPVASFGDENDYLSMIQVYTEDRPQGRGPTGTAFREDRSYICNDIFRDPATMPWREEAERRGYRASAAFPIREQGVTRGVITVYADEAGIFRDREIALLEEAAIDVSFALDNIQREAARGRAEEALAESARAQRELVTLLEKERSKLLAAQEVAKIGSWETEFATGSVVWSQEVHRIFDTDPADYRPTHDRVLQRVHPEDRTMVDEAFQRGLASPWAHSVVHRIMTAEGRVKIVEERWQTIFDEKGEPGTVVGTCQDITERRQAEEAASRLAAIVASSDDAIVGKDLNGIITSWNAGAERVFGYTAEEMIGESVLRLIPPDRQGEEMHILETVRQGDAMRPFETVRLRKDGRVIDVSITISPIKDATGRIIGAAKIARNITARKKAAERLQRSEASLANAQRIARIGSWELDITTGALAWSAEIYKIFGLNQAEFGASYDAFIAAVHPDDRARVDAAQRAAVSGGIPLGLEHRIVRPDGTERVVVELADLTRNAAGQPAHLAGTVQDITERVQAETRLRESEAQFHTMLDAMPQLAWMAEADGSIYWYNQQWFDYTGATPEELQGWGWQRVHDPEILPSVIERWQAAVMGGTLFEMDFPLRAADGTYRWFLTRVFPLKDSAGRVVRWFGTNTDITTKREAAEEIASLNATLEQRVVERTEALRESEQRLAIAVQAAQAGVWSWDLSSGRLIWSPEVFRIFGLDPVEGASLQKWRELVHPEDVQLAEERMAISIRNHTRLEDEYRVVPRPGEVRWVSVLGDTSFADNGEPRRMSGVCLDITERKRAELELQKLTAELQLANQELESFSTAVTRDLRVAEAADRVKSTFLATMSHELRTPLNSIIGFTGIVLMGKAGPLNVEQKKQLEMVRESAWHLLALINDVLDISKIEAGQVEVRAELFVLPASIQRVLAMISPLAEKKGLLLAAEVAPELGEMLGDQRRVEQILINLLTNAVKFTEYGHVTLTAELLGDFRPSPGTLPRPAVRLRVTDTGIGIRPEDLGILFQPFQQVDSGFARQVEGTGLGLAICGRLAKLLGGEITAASIWSQGSEFTVTLPLQHPIAS